MLKQAADKSAAISPANASTIALPDVVWWIVGIEKPDF
jgi:hypothetical protein